MTTILPDLYPEAVFRPVMGHETTGNYTDSENLKAVWHKTVGSNMPWSTYEAGGGVPHVTFDRDGTVWQHYSFNQYSRALRNLWGGVQTNLDGAIQIELVGYPGKGSTKAQRKAMRKFSRWLFKHGVPGKWLNKRPTEARYRKRGQKKLSNEEWDNGSGHVGHIDIPENDHSDPRLLKAEWKAIERGWISPWTLLSNLRKKFKTSL